jgi:hypothetical protein
LRWNSSKEAGGMFWSVFRTSVSCSQLAGYFFSCFWFRALGVSCTRGVVNIIPVMLCGCTQSADCGDRLFP